MKRNSEFSQLKLKIPVEALGELKIIDFDAVYLINTDDLKNQNFPHISVEPSDLNDSYLSIFIFVGECCIHKIIMKQCYTSCSETHVCDKNLDLHVDYKKVQKRHAAQDKKP